MHAGIKKYYCLLCPFKTGQSSNLKAHMSKHSTKRPFACDQCEYRAKLKSSLKEHTKRHLDVGGNCKRPGRPSKKGRKQLRPVLV